MCQLPKTSSLFYEGTMTLVVYKCPSRLSPLLLHHLLMLIFYVKQEIMYKKLLYAISEGQGSFDLSWVFRNNRNPVYWWTGVYSPGMIIFWLHLGPRCFTNNGLIVSALQRFWPSSGELTFFLTKLVSICMNYNGVKCINVLWWQFVDFWICWIDGSWILLRLDHMILKV